MKKIRTILLGFALVFSVGVMAPVAVNAADVVSTDNLVTSDQCPADSDSTVCQEKNANPEKFIKTIINTLLFLIGATSVVMIIFAGITYVISAGDSAQLTKAKNTLTYAIIGLVIAFLAYAIVNWVITLFIPATP